MSNIAIGWRAGPTERGTLTLIYSCLITIFACTWTVLHLNAPGLHDKWWQKASRKAKWMLITILMPEFIFSKAICDLRLALNDLREFDTELQGRYKDILKWTVRNDKIEHTWSWQVDYGSGSSFLYWILGLQPPLSRHRPIEKIAEHDVNDPMREKAENGQEGSTGDISTGEKQSDEDQEPGEYQDRNEGQDRMEDCSDTIAISRRSRRKPADQTQPEVFTYHTTQRWTTTHAYFANMGGLLYPFEAYGQRDRLDYYVLPGVNLSHRFRWLSSHPHPLRGLVLSKEDIEDRSKADWLLKGLTVLQITWLVLTVLVRGVKGLSVSQLEIATSAFSVFAIATYAANWWKPKDVSRPILLQNAVRGWSIQGSESPVRAFTQYLMHPAHAADVSVQFIEQCRIQNDVLWMEKGVPLIFSIMAVSALIFGGLHCLAWNLEFPTRAELMLWRASSLTSMILPVVALALSFCLNYLVTTYPDGKLISLLSEELKPLSAFPKDYRRLLENPRFQFWDWGERVILASMPTGARNFEAKPSKNIRQQLEQKGAWEKYIDIEQKILVLSSCLQALGESWETAEWSVRSTDVLPDIHLHLLHIVLSASDEVLDFWDDFEDYLRKRYTAPDTSFPDMKYMRHVLDVGNKFLKEVEWIRDQQGGYTRISQFLTISSGMIYAASRLIILTLLFTSLRVVPEGVYEVTPWIRFLPSIS